MRLEDFIASINSSRLLNSWIGNMAQKNLPRATKRPIAAPGSSRGCRRSRNPRTRSSPRSSHVSGAGNLGKRFLHHWRGLIWCFIYRGFRLRLHPRLLPCAAKGRCVASWKIFCAMVLMSGIQPSRRVYLCNKVLQIYSNIFLLAGIGFFIDAMKTEARFNNSHHVVRNFMSFAYHTIPVI